MLVSSGERNLRGLAWAHITSDTSCATCIGERSAFVLGNMHSKSKVVTAFVLGNSHQDQGAFVLGNLTQAPCLDRAKPSG